MQYKCLKQQVFEEGVYKITPIQQEHMLSIKEWRNAQISILRQNQPLNDQEQLFYWENVITALFNQECPAQIIFSFFKNDVLIGYGGLTHIDWNAKRGEVSFLLETTRTFNDASYAVEYTQFLILLKKVLFDDLKFHRIFAETFDLRPVHIATLEKCGFVLEGRLKDHVKIENKYYDSLIHGLINDQSL